MPAAHYPKQGREKYDGAAKKVFGSLDEAIAEETPEVQARIGIEGERIDATRDAAIRVAGKVRTKSHEINAQRLAARQKDNADWLGRIPNEFIQNLD